MIELLSVVFFFFQAEDGIRDYKVTGVQTCALPIWGLERLPLARAERLLTEAVGSLTGAPDGEGGWLRRQARARLLALVQRYTLARSEERRVGEEGRSRWAPDH